jgi:hypothetical protein
MAPVEDEAELMGKIEFLDIFGRSRMSDTVGSGIGGRKTGGAPMVDGVVNVCELTAVRVPLLLYELLCS